MKASRISTYVNWIFGAGDL